MTLALLEWADGWRATESLPEALPAWPGPAVLEAAEKLWRRRFLVGPGEASPAERALGHWRRWNPVAGLFHLATKDVAYADPEEEPAPAAPIPTLNPFPGPLKDYPGANSLRLPTFRRDGSLARVLLERRTWRGFGPGALGLEQLSDLLGLTWGVQGWVHLEDHRAALKTSPSGGARHPLEAYVVAREVSDLAAGIYHYDPDEHALVRLAEPPERTELVRWLAGQEWFASASAVVFMTALFQRTRSRYRHPRAYRVVLLEAGHFCQTFCLVATQLGLAPFCTAALADTAIERALGLDGVSESVLYAAGVGARPADVEWAAYPDGKANPRISPPAHARRGTERQGRASPAAEA